MTIDVNDVKEMIAQQGLVILQLQGALRESQRRVEALEKAGEQHDDDITARRVRMVEAVDSARADAPDAV